MTPCDSVNTLEQTLGSQILKGIFHLKNTTKGIRETQVGKVKQEFAIHHLIVLLKLLAQGCRRKENQEQCIRKLDLNSI